MIRLTGIGERHEFDVIYDLTMRRLIHRWLGPVICVATFVACASTGKTSALGDSVDGGNGGGFGDPTADGAPATSGDDGTTGTFGGSDASVSGDACQHLAVQFTPKVPLVYVLADRSGSMFTQVVGADGGATDEWTSLRTAALAVVQGLDSQVAFGFGAYTGINPSTTAAMCPILDEVPIATNNYSAIATLYDSLGKGNFKAETPAQQSLEKVAQSLTQAASQPIGGGQPGGKYILFVTDSETDFCDDGNPVCPADAVIAELQKLSTQGIQTLILGVHSNVSNISAAVLQSFANAGAGLPALAPPNGAQSAPLLPADINSQCSGVAGWKQLFTAAGLQAGQALGTYAAPGGTATNATLYAPDATNVADLTTKIGDALKTVKSCSFDLQGKIKVDLTQASRGRVSIDGMPVPYDATNGWTMATATQLALQGTSCQQWRTAGMNISFDFPCDVIQPLL
jgi:hypothetical protein